MEQKNKEPKIVIIGGGVAGVAAATSLLDRGFEDVTIIEAEDRLGGRIYTVPFGKFNQNVKVIIILCFGIENI